MGAGAAFAGLEDHHKGVEAVHEMAYRPAEDHCIGEDILVVQEIVHLSWVFLYSLLATAPSFLGGTITFALTFISYSSLSFVHHTE